MHYIGANASVRIIITTLQRGTEVSRLTAAHTQGSLMSLTSESRSTCQRLAATSSEVVILSSFLLPSRFCGSTNVRIIVYYIDTVPLIKDNSGILAKAKDQSFLR